MGLSSMELRGMLRNSGTRILRTGTQLAGSMMTMLSLLCRHWVMLPFDPLEKSKTSILPAAPLCCCCCRKGSVSPPTAAREAGGRGPPLRERMEEWLVEALEGVLTDTLDPETEADAGPGTTTAAATAAAAGAGGVGARILKARLRTCPWDPSISRSNSGSLEGPACGSKQRLTDQMRINPSKDPVKMRKACCLTGAKRQE